MRAHFEPSRPERARNEGEKGRGGGRCEVVVLKRSRAVRQSGDATPCGMTVVTLHDIYVGLERPSGALPPEAEGSRAKPEASRHPLSTSLQLSPLESCRNVRQILRRYAVGGNRTLLRGESHQGTLHVAPESRGRTRG